MKLFVWTEVLCDHGCGMAIVYAKDEEAAKQLMEKKFPHYVRAQLPFSEVEVFEDEECAFYVYGGG